MNISNINNFINVKNDILKCFADMSLNQSEFLFKSNIILDKL